MTVLGRKCKMFPNFGICCRQLGWLKLWVFAYAYTVDLCQSAPGTAQWISGLRSQESLLRPNSFSQQQIPLVDFAWKLFAYKLKSDHGRRYMVHSATRLTSCSRKFHNYFRHCGKDTRLQLSFNGCVAWNFRKFLNHLFWQPASSNVLLSALPALIRPTNCSY